MDGLQRLGFGLNPGGDTGAAGRSGSEQILRDFGDPFFRRQLLDVAIDRRRPQPVAVLRRRHDDGRKGRPRSTSAVRAVVDGGAMFAHFDDPFGKIEHFRLSQPHDRTRVERGAAMPAGRREMFEDAMGIFDLSKLVALLAAAQLARKPAKTAQDARLLFHPVARGRFRTVRAGKVQTSLEFDVFSPKRLDLASQRCDQFCDFGRQIESEDQPHVSQNRNAPKNLGRNVIFSTHSGLAVTGRPFAPCKPLKYNNSASLLFGLIWAYLVLIGVVWAYGSIFCLMRHSRFMLGIALHAFRMTIGTATALDGKGQV